MPGPAPPNVTGFVGGGFNVSRTEPRCMSLVAAVAVSWTTTEGQLNQLVATALGQASLQESGSVGVIPNWVALTAMQQAETIRTRLKLVRALIVPRLGVRHLESWKSVEKLLLQRSRERNAIVHADWHYSDLLPGNIVRFHEGVWEVWSEADFMQVARRFHKLGMKIGMLNHDISRSSVA